MGAVSGDIAAPSVLEHPGVQYRIPFTALRDDLALEQKRTRIDFKNIQSQKLLLGLIEILVVVDAVVQPVHPLALGIEEGLRRLTLDLGVDRFLLPVGSRNPVMIEREQASAQQ